MTANKNSVIRLSEYRLYVSDCGVQAADSDLSIRYNDYPQIRDAARRITTLVAQYYCKELFCDICVHCGNCCNGRVIPVSAREIMEVSLFLNLQSEYVFRLKYTDKACTWNETDGILKTVNGRCVFLQRTPTGSFFCTIYPVRPSVCSTLREQTSCEKPPGKMIYYLENIFIHNDTIKIVTKSGISHERVVEDSNLLKVIRFLKDKVQSILDGFCDAGETDRFKEEYFEHSKNERSMSEDCSALAKTSGTGDILADLRTRGDLLKVVNTITYNPLKNTIEFSITGMQIQKESVLVIGHIKSRKFQKIFVYRDYPILLPIVREFIKVIARSENNAIQDVLWHINPTCFMCGICCKNYAVEVSPYEIEKIAEHLHISVKQMWKKYLKRGLYTWNPESGILLKEASTSRAGNSLVCVFLKKKRKDIYHCKIYEARPDVCREYTPHGDKCRHITQKKKWETLVENILNINIIGNTIYLTTCYTEGYRLPPLSIYLENEKRLNEIYYSLQKEIEQLILKNNTQLLADIKISWNFNSQALIRKSYVVRSLSDKTHRSK